MPDITLSVNGPATMTPLGFSVTYAINTIPVCLIDLDPTTSTILQSSDQDKRKTVTLNCTVKSDTGLPTATTRSLTFTGLYDGLSPSQSVGNGSYSAVVKGNQQILIETYTRIPGLNPVGLNPYNRVNNFISDLSGQSGTSYIGLDQNKLKLLSQDMDIMSYYLANLIAILQIQASGDYTGLLATDNFDINFNKLLQGPKFIANAGKAANLLQKINTSAIAGAFDQLAKTAQSANGGFKMIDNIINGPTNIWENMLAFYGSFGCNLVCSNSNIYIVPDNGFITFDHSAYSPQLSGQVNAAMPADYSSQNYNDNGYRDIGAVGIVINDNQVFDGITVNPSFVLGYFQGPSTDPGTSLVVLPNHPFSFLDLSSGLATELNRTKLLQMTPDMVSHYKDKKTYATASSDPAGVAAEVNSDPVLLQYKAAADNYAQIKYYQLRYGDRIGQIIMNFNPNWVPGTCGTLYIKEGLKAGTYLDFLVQSVTHRIAISAPTNGTSMTVVTFSCGRTSTDPATVSSDLFFGYDSGKMTAIQTQFISDIS